MKLLIISLHFVLLFLSLLGCFSKEIAGVPAPAIESKIPARAEAMPAWEERWEQIIGRARKEGKVVVYSSTGTPEMKAALAQAFKEKYGIDVDQIIVPGAGIAQKVLVERRAGIYLADVYIGGAPTAVTLLKPADVLAPLEPALILPEVVNPKAWLDSKLPFIDSARIILSFLNYVVPPIVVNTNLVRQEDIKSYKDLLDPRWKGKIILNDPTTTGAAITWFGNVSEKIMDLDFMHNLAKQEPMINRDWRLQIEWLSHGKYAIVLAPHSDTVGTFLKAGAPIRRLVPVEGTHRTGGGGRIALVNGAPHPNAARLFINWLLTRETQTLYSKIALLPSGRVDVPTDHLGPETLMQPGVNYFTDDEDFILGDVKRMKTAQEIFGHLLK